LEFLRNFRLSPLVGTLIERPDAPSHRNRRADQAFSPSVVRADRPGSRRDFAPGAAWRGFRVAWAQWLWQDDLCQAAAVSGSPDLRPRSAVRARFPSGWRAAPS